jgi:cytoskeletal protein CcmA (bactofilin family)
MLQSPHRVAAALLVALVVIGGLPTVAVAQQPAADESESSGAVVRIDENETVEGTLDATAGAVVIAGTVDGDVSATAGSVLVTDAGRVTGDLNATAASVLIEGRVDGDVVVAAAALQLRDGSAVGGSLDAGVADARIAGSTGGDVAVSATTLAVAPTTTIDGSLTYQSEDATVADGAAISGTVTRDDDLEVASPGAFDGGSETELPTIPSWVGAVYSGLSSLLLGAILLLAAPRFSGRIATVGTTQPLRSGGVGLLTLLGTPIALLILFVTIVGIPSRSAALSSSARLSLRPPSTARSCSGRYCCRSATTGTGGRPLSSAWSPSPSCGNSPLSAGWLGSWSSSSVSARSPPRSTSSGDVTRGVTATPHPLRRRFIPDRATTRRMS